MISTNETRRYHRQRWRADRRAPKAFTEVVETALNRRISSFMSATDDDLELSVEVFVLEAADETGHDVSSVPISAE